ncbi:MAG TPA: hypothetical protein VMF65_10770 [Acidimicrobiales bacterium]|nr:hypothetical protein [Acidimicrobiales bacterium]
MTVLLGASGLSIPLSPLWPLRRTDVSFGAADEEVGSNGKYERCRA